MRGVATLSSSDWNLKIWASKEGIKGGNRLFSYRSAIAPYCARPVSAILGSLK
jgi:hypothetical protein